MGAELNVPNAERLFILGLLHNIGELIVHQFLPEKIAESTVDDLSMLPWQKQQEVLGFTYGDCSAELLKLWQLPYSLIEPIRNQDDDDLADVSRESSLLYLAKRIMVHNNQFSRLSLDKFISPAQLDLFSLKHDTIRSATSYCDMERLGVLSILKPSAAMIY